MNCRFCQPKKENYNKIIRETENFFIIPTLGQFVEGYLLIIPKKHYVCFGALPDELLKEYHFLKKEIERIYENVYQKPIYFEHGPANNIRGGCCVNHAHMHLVPRNVDIIPELKKYFDVKKIKQIKELKNKYRKQKPYLFFENIKGEMFVCNANPVPSQYIRQIIAAKLDLNDKWDWRKYPFLNKIEKCQQRLNKSLSQWIKNSDKLKELIIDKEKNLSRIKEYDLPCLDFLIPKNRSDTKQFLNRYKSIVARAMPLNEKNVRKYKTNIRSFEEYLSFIDNIELNNYQIILSEYVPCKYAGAIISDSNKTIIELLKGTHDELVHGTSIPYTSFVDFTGKIRYSEKMSKKEKNLVWKTLKNIKISKGNYLKGYFEFLITTEEKLKFIDYDTKIIKT